MTDYGMDLVIPCTITVIILTCGLAAYKLIRPYFSVKVNCWFCNTNTVVPFGNQNCWDCPSCDQYNGFSQDGGYNKPIPAQHDELLNHGICCAICEPSEFHPASNGLCQLCNRNQLLKIKQLADFVPVNQSNYDSEVELFKYQLDHSYMLCHQCQATVSHKLAKQDHKLRSKLLEARLKDSDTSSIYGHVTCRVHSPLHVSLLRFTSLLCTLSLLGVSAYHLNRDSQSKVLSINITLPKVVVRYIQLLYEHAQGQVFLGLFSALAAIFLHGKHSLYLVDAMVSFTWLGLIALHPGKAYLGQVQGLEPSDIYLLQTGVALFCTFLSFWCAVCRRVPIKSRKNTRRRYDFDNSNMSCDGSMAASQAGDISLASDLDSCDVISQSSWVGSHPSEAGEPVVNSQLDGLSLGTPKKRSNSASVFPLTVNNAFTTTPSSLASLSSLKKRPLIRPATFSPSTVQSLRQSKRVKQKLLHEDDGKPGPQSKTDINKLDQGNDESSSSSSSSTQCPVGSTTPSNSQLTTGVKRTLNMPHVILAASVIINISLLVYVFGNKYFYGGFH